MLCKIPSTTILGILIIGFCLAVFFSFEKLSFAVPNSNLLMVPRENPQGGGVFFFFTFKMRLAQKKKKTLRMYFLYSVNISAKQNFEGGFFFLSRSTNFLRIAQKKPHPWGFSRGTTVPVFLFAVFFWFWNLPVFYYQKWKIWKWCIVFYQNCYFAAFFNLQFFFSNVPVFHICRFFCCLKKKR